MVEGADAVGLGTRPDGCTATVSPPGDVVQELDGSIGQDINKLIPRRQKEAPL